MKHSLANAAGLYVLAFGCVNAALGQSQVIPIQSGDGLTMVRYVDAGDGRDGTVGIVSRVQGSLPVVLTDNADESHQPLAFDPSARWIVPPTLHESDRRMLEYTAPFTINDDGRVAFAELEFVAMADGPHAAGRTADLYLNDQLIGVIPDASSGTAGRAFVSDITPWLHAGMNQLSMRVPVLRSEGGVIFSGRVSIWADPGRPETTSDRADAEAPGLTVDASVMEGVPTCVGFSCRPRGDVTSDGLVGLNDYRWFEACITGAGAPLLGECEFADLNCDGEVDLVDVGVFQQVFGSL